MTNNQFLEWKSRASREFATWVMGRYFYELSWNNHEATSFSECAIDEVLRILRSESAQTQIEIMQRSSGDKE